MHASRSTLSTETSPAPKAAPKPKSRKAFWLRQLHSWHWMSSAISLIGLLLFAVTGLTLNHAADIEGKAVSQSFEAQLPPPLAARVRADAGADGGATGAQSDAKRPLPPAVADWLDANLPVRTRGLAEWSADEIYLGLPRPGGDAWIAIDRQTGAVTAETSSRGWVAYLNDLHKGRNAGPVWAWFIDIFVIACVVFAVTGLFLLQLHAAKRRSTWPLVGLGLAIPAAIALFFIH
ncbi:hypothetical protein GVO57_13190 [Sphingomonas changnyeongensis]|uniref:PepSY-associated TM helix domain-containing protein n=1 Tax=Sphingomonas changnyeongensis TaxID=2698679 RepID=A0A7Z2NXE5_9SPHN|nr:PepSY-associated TM helix domain-containing protein [Sphingomonas changnyeongensis]QHL91578.1 hypothetical protein GVO57_13190 [Sphingomonas changnyeongensis]